MLSACAPWMENSLFLLFLLLFLLAIFFCTSFPFTHFPSNWYFDYHFFFFSSYYIFFVELCLFVSFFLSLYITQLDSKSEEKKEVEKKNFWCWYRWPFHFKWAKCFVSFYLVMNVTVDLSVWLHAYRRIYSMSHAFWDRLFLILLCHIQTLHASAFDVHNNSSLQWLNQMEIRVCFIAVCNL